jgi:hypothetical protein
MAKFFFKKNLPYQMALRQFVAYPKPMAECILCTTATFIFLKSITKIIINYSLTFLNLSENSSASTIFIFAGTLYASNFNLQ